MTSSRPIAAASRDARRCGALLALLVAVSGCATVKSHLPHRTPPEPPRQTVTPPPAKPPKPAPPRATPVDARGFQVIAPATWERDRDRARQALAKADPKALAPGDVGYYLDVLQGRLRQVVVPPARATRNGRAFSLDLSPTVRFTPGAAPLGPGSADALAPLARLLADYEQVLVAVRVTADTGSAGDARLAQQRAVGLAQALAAAGAAKKRIVVYGSAPGHPDRGARVEVLLEPIVRATEVPARAK